MSEKRSIEYSHGGRDFEGFLITEGSGRPRPTVLIFPNIFGLKDEDVATAEKLVGLGYAAFGVDLYGKGNRPTTREDAMPFMQPLREDRPHLQDLLLHVLETARALPDVDAAQIAAIGFCFGGLCVLDLARTGAEVKGVASFHGLFVPPGNREGTPIKARVAAYHGWADPLVPPAQVVALGEELTRGGCDWQIHAYGGAVHGFTHARPPEEGIPYNRLAAERSWASLERFLAECFA
jgi:dienelactone hydrolase